MQGFLDNFKNLVKSEKACTDNNVFKLHYKFSVILLIVFSILLSSKQYFGEPMVCDGDHYRHIMDIFCWATATFILSDNGKDQDQSSFTIEGLGNGVNQNTFSLTYYQWVCLLFFIQALLFYTPRYLWKAWESDRLEQIVQNLCGALVPDKWSVEYKNKLRTYILTTENHDVFAYRFAICEFLNFCNLICQAFFMNWYLDGKFARYGYEVATHPWGVANNAVFPKVTKCTYNRYGSGGSITNKDALCILPLNVLNEKFFLILWYWLIFMFVATIGALIYRILVISFRQFRTYLLMAQVRSMKMKKIDAIGKRLSYGQFFLLYNMGKAINPIIYRELLESIFDHLEFKKDPEI